MAINTVMAIKTVAIKTVIDCTLKSDDKSLKLVPLFGLQISMNTFISNVHLNTSC